MTFMRVSEVYDRATIQGEGPHVGKVCTFVRTYGCNLHCQWCDTPFTWDTDGLLGTVYPVETNCQVIDVLDVAATVLDLSVPICVVSGGEPLIQSRAVMHLASILDQAGVETHVETNGTRPPPDYLTVAHWSVSPKLPSAESGANYDMEVLRAWAEHPRAIFKIVVGSPHEVREAALFMNSLDVPLAHRWVMPEGTMHSTVDAVLDAIVPDALDLRLNVSGRMHVQLWGSERNR